MADDGEHAYNSDEEQDGPDYRAGDYRLRERVKEQDKLILKLRAEIALLKEKRKTGLRQHRVSVH